MGPALSERAFYSVIEAAAWLGVSPRQIARLIADGRLPSATLDRRRLIHEKHLREFAERLAGIAS